jgi:hypothetical protein
VGHWEILTSLRLVESVLAIPQTTPLERLNLENQESSTCAPKAGMDVDRGMLELHSVLAVKCLTLVHSVVSSKVYSCLTVLGMVTMNLPRMLYYSYDRLRNRDWKCLFNLLVLSITSILWIVVTCVYAWLQYSIDYVPGIEMDARQRHSAVHTLPRSVHISSVIAKFRHIFFLPSPVARSVSETGSGNSAQASVFNPGYSTSEKVAPPFPQVKQ